jgi:hypothetical protein
MMMALNPRCSSTSAPRRPRKIQDAFGDKFGNGIMAFSAFLGGFGCAFGMGFLLSTWARHWEVPTKMADSK